MDGKFTMEVTITVEKESVEADPSVLSIEHPDYTRFLTASSHADRVLIVGGVRIYVNSGVSFIKDVISDPAWGGYLWLFFENFQIF